MYERAAATVNYSMELFKSHFDSDVILTAFVVIPATTAWIVSDSAPVALSVAALMLFGYFYVLPKIQRGEITFQSFVHAYMTLRTLIMTRRVKSI